MGILSPKPETTLVVILGASKFPKIKALESNPAFRASAKAFKDYLCHLKRFNLPKINLLDLFDSPGSPSEIDERIANFLKTRSEEIKNSKGQASDVLIYYVGHGAFTDDGDTDYFLTLQNTREEQKTSSGYLIRSLAHTLKKFATHQRKYLILDCCFSAVTYKSFQAAPIRAVVEQTLESMDNPTRGTALLCAASKAEPAKSPPYSKYTMFSTALLDILNNGVENAPQLLSFKTLGELTRRRIKELFQDEAVRPEVLSPDQRQGDVAQIPFFPNPVSHAAETAGKKSSHSDDRGQKNDTLLETSMDVVRKIYREMKVFEQKFQFVDYLCVQDIDSVSLILRQLLNTRLPKQIKQEIFKVREILLEILTARTDIEKYNEFKNRFCSLCISLEDFMNSSQKA